MLTATLLRAAALSLLLILAPLLWLDRNRLQAPTAFGRWRIALYFLAIGLAFLFIEIASIQHFILFLGRPVYAIAVVLCAFLVFAGLGSGIAPSLAARLDASFTIDSRSRRTLLRTRQPALSLAVLGIAAVSLVHLLALPPLFHWLMWLPDAAKVAVALILIAPLAFWMGMPFPLALARVATGSPGLVPWAWGINGCASVLSAVLAVMVAMSLGFTTLVLIAIGLYAVAVTALR